MKMIQDPTRTLTPEQEALLAEMKAALASYDGPIKRIPAGIKNSSRPVQETRRVRFSNPRER
jgi:hypothetical protein